MDCRKNERRKEEWITRMQEWISKRATAPWN